MNGGITISDPSGGLVVDEEFVNYVEHQAGTIVHQVTTSVTATGLIPLSPVVTSLFPPVISAAWAANNNVYCFGYELVGNPGSWTAVKLKMGSMSGSHTVEINYTVFAPPVERDGFGLRAHKADGDIFFATDRPPLELGNPVPWDFTWDLYRTSSRSPIYGLIVRPNPEPGGQMLLGLLPYAYTTRVDLLRGGTHSLLVNSGYGYGLNNTIREMGVFQTSYDGYDLSDSDYIGTEIPMTLPRG